MRASHAYVLELILVPFGDKRKQNAAVAQQSGAINDCDGAAF